MKYDSNNLFVNNFLIKGMQTKFKLFENVQKIYPFVFLNVMSVFRIYLLKPNALGILIVNNFLTKGM